MHNRKIYVFIDEARTRGNDEKYKMRIKDWVLVLKSAKSPGFYVKLRSKNNHKMQFETQFVK